MIEDKEDNIIAGKHMFFHCELHPKVENIHLASIEHHCKYSDPESHKEKIISKYTQTLVDAS